MENVETTEKQQGKQKTIGDVKTTLDVWSRMRRYQEREAKVGRELKLPEVAAELIEKALEAEGITA